MALNLHLKGALEWLQLTSLTTSAPISLGIAYLEGSFYICSLGGSALHQSRRSIWSGGDGLGNPWSDGHLSTGVLMFGHARKQPSIIQVGLTALLTIPIYHAENSGVGQHLLHSTVSGSPQSQASWPIRWGAPTARGDEHGLGSGCSWLRPPWTPTKETLHWMPILPCAKMRPRLLRPSKRPKFAKEAEVCCADAIKETEPHHAIHACTLQQSHKDSMLELECEATPEERAGLPNIHGGLQCSLAGLSTWRLWDTNASLTTPHWQHATSLHFGNAGYHPTTGYIGQGTNFNSFATYTVRDVSTPNWNQMAAPLIWPGSNHTETRGRGSCWARHHSWRAAPPKAERREASGEAPQGESLGSLLEKLWSPSSD